MLVSYWLLQILNIALEKGTTGGKGWESGKDFIYFLFLPWNGPALLLILYRCVSSESFGFALRGGTTLTPAQGTHEGREEVLGGHGKQA